MEAFSKIVWKSLKSPLVNGDHVLSLEMMERGNDNPVNFYGSMDMELVETGKMNAITRTNTFVAVAITRATPSFVEDLFLITTIFLIGLISIYTWMIMYIAHSKL